MTRVNLLIPTKITDQHLIAELKEINQLAGSFRVSLKSKNGIKTDDIPKNYKLNAGHVKFFYSKGQYLHKRFNLLKEEAIKRGFNINISFNNEWLKNNRNDLYNDWLPDEKDYLIIKSRIKEKILLKPTWYRYYGNKIDDIDTFLNENYGT